MVQYYEEAEDGTVDSADCDNANVAQDAGQVVQQIKRLLLLCY